MSKLELELKKKVIGMVMKRAYILRSLLRIPNCWANTHEWSSLFLVFLGLHPQHMKFPG